MYAPWPHPPCLLCTTGCGCAGGGCPPRDRLVSERHHAARRRHRKVAVRLPGKGNPNSHGTRPVHQIITMIKWIRTSSLSIKNALSSGCGCAGGGGPPRGRLISERHHAPRRRQPAPKPPHPKLMAPRTGLGCPHIGSSVASSWHTFFFFFLFTVTLTHRVESYKSLWALNTSPPRNRCTFL